MAYSESPITVERMRDNLLPLIGSARVTWRVDDGQARRFAYKVREALAVAQLHRERFPELAAAADAGWRVTVPDRTTVRAELAPALRARVVNEDAEVPTARAEVDTRKGMTIDNIIARWEIGSESKITFQNADLSREDLLRLYEWAQGVGVMFFENTGALTLVAYEPDTAPFAWSPEDLEDDE